MKKILFLIITAFLVIYAAYFAGIYYFTFSEGTRSGELIKYSKKGVFFKTHEGEISQGISGAQIFKFSVEDGQKEVIQKLEDYQGKYVKLTYKERYATFAWLGDTKYFIIDVKRENSPHFNKD